MTKTLNLGGEPQNIFIPENGPRPEKKLKTPGLGLGMYIYSNAVAELSISETKMIYLIGIDIMASRDVCGHVRSHGSFDKSLCSYQPEPDHFTNIFSFPNYRSLVHHIKIV